MKIVTRLLALTIVLIALAAPSCGQEGCPECRPGTHASNPSEPCSFCVADGDGGASAVDALEDSLNDRPQDALTEASSDANLPEGGTDGGIDTAADVPPDAVTCTAFPNVGCFTGTECASSRVDAQCVGGIWTCPSGSHATEFCAPDGGVDTPADAGTD